MAILKFIRGKQDVYVTQATAGGDYSLNDRFKRDNPNYANIIYLATDTQTLWMNGKPYGISGQSLQFLSTVVTGVKQEGNILIFTTYDSNATDNKTDTYKVTLTSVSAADKSAVVVTPPSGDENNYVIAIKTDEKTVSQDQTNGLKTVIKLGKSQDSKSMYLTDVDGAQIGNAISTEEFLKESFLDDAEIKTKDASGNSGHFLYLHVGFDDGTDKAFYVDLSAFYNSYVGGKGISINSEGVSPTVSVKLDSSWIDFDLSGNLSDSSLTVELNYLDNKIDNAIVIANEAVTEKLRGIPDDSWIADVSSSQTIWAVKNYTDSSYRELVGKPGDSPFADTINGAKAYAESLLTWKDA